MVVLYSTNLPHPILPGKIYTSTLMLFLYRHTEIRSNKEKNEKFFIWFWSFLSFQNHSKTLFPIDVVCMHLYAYIYTFIWRIWLGRRFILHHECCSGLLKVGNLICYFDWPMIWCGGWKNPQHFLWERKRTTTTTTTTPTKNEAFDHQCCARHTYFSVRFWCTRVGLSDVRLVGTSLLFYCFLYNNLCLFLGPAQSNNVIKKDKLWFSSSASSSCNANKDES